MALNKESNGYILMFSAVLVIITAVVLVLVFGATNPTYKVNQELEKQQNILQAVKIEVERDGAKEAFSKAVKKGFAINPEGKVLVEGAFGTPEFDKVFNLDLAKELRKKDEADQHYPVYEVENEGKLYYVIGMRGKGLWDAIWGYVSIEGDFSTVFGAVFDHKGETPGLGAEIKETWYTAQFPGKQINDPQGNFVSVSVIKKGSAPVSDYNVDGVSGGTLTSNGLSDMLYKFLGAFAKYSKTVKAPVSEMLVDPLPTDTVDSATANMNIIDSASVNSSK